MNLNFVEICAVKFIIFAKQIINLVQPSQLSKTTYEEMTIFLEFFCFKKKIFSNNYSTTYLF